MIFDDSSSGEEEEDEFELVASVVAMEEDFRRPRRGSQIGRRMFLEDSIMGHDGLMRK